ncbi:class II glutamine amidotransferase [Bifidobacterium eulemuris]|uniref:Class II glutamine amidotransferase n=1 Tax=Bifidobacterium eulemuris TaxID=1765219 RepID=A0A261GDY7_9BIFI|nr:class II glutamine amidotransferase [Bifidobacterium eulemuris]OZG69473.1 class II glutamine amidotransferase [Bifidobacterium eulemuris]QOL32166.1 class II glutamine amidotransferase [Bifidobacterium eulemuris]
MCRLLGYATAGENASLCDILGDRLVSDFRELSEIHNDGWGVAQVVSPAERADAADGGAPTPETNTKLYKSTVPARHDSTFATLSGEPARGALWHLRLASSNLPLIMENQQPFFANGLSFIHNGDISDSHGRNITTNRTYPVSQPVFLSTGGRSDSAIFFAVILEYIGFGFALDEAVSQAVRELRQAYPRSSYNCMIQSNDQFIALCAAGRERTSARIVEVYEEYGRGEQAHDYRVMRYRALRDERGRGTGVVVTSSGYEQPAEEGWNVLENDQMIVASNRDGTFHLRSI